jgi:adenine-specific DNA-methyltransferase
MNRQFILTEQLDDHISKIKERFEGVLKGEQGGISKEVDWKGGGSFVYAELMQCNAAFIEEIEEADGKEALQGIWQRMQESAFLSYKVSPSAINKEKEAFGELTLDEQKRFLVEVLDKNQLYINYSEIEDKDYGISEELREKNHQFYSLK